ncbi:acyl-CoA dehydrogenase family protein [Halomicrococcus sp. NG-SE-24]|uniref:acyl-CoA dehydrogenase family protein n=1 Tax=Halomicrococcus sp. NG-SE-24 TaxID=3436928 RepID=UPI003D972A70
MTLQRPYADLTEGRDCNYWRMDPTLRRHARSEYGDEFDWAEPKLDEWGSVVGTRIADNADVANRHGPILHTYDRHGDVQNRVEYHPAQAENDRLAYEAGVVADSFEAPPDRDERLGLTHTLVMQTLLAYCDVGFACPVSMTAGAALVLENYADDSEHADVLRRYYERLTARDVDDHVEGAMFLTEKQGGSDVGANETTAVEADDGTYRLTGEKWFCSNVDAEGTLVLARREGAPDGTDGLSLFLVPHTKPDGSLNDQTYRRLKDKLGTVSVPTGEVELDGALGYLVGEPENGFKQMTRMLNFERVANAAGATGVSGRALLEAKVHAANREAFGKRLDEHPLLRRDLFELTVDYEAMTAFTMEAMSLLDAAERGDGDDAVSLMRAVVPVAKYRTGRMAVETTSYAMEILGGNGYVDEFVTNRLLRDAQVLPIWEGTSNVLSLELLRSLSRGDAGERLLARVGEYLQTPTHPSLADATGTVETELDALRDALSSLAATDPDEAQLVAKELADYVFDVYAAALLLSAAQRRLDDEDDAREAVVARTFVDDRFDTDRGRGIPDDNPPNLDAYDAVVRYHRLDPDAIPHPEVAD